MQVGVVGGTGFVGRVIVRRLVDAGHDAVVVHRGMQEVDDEPVGIADDEALARSADLAAMDPPRPER